MDLRSDELEKQLAKALRTAMTRTGERRTELAAVAVPALGAPLRWGGLALGVGADVVVMSELGRALEPLAGLSDTLLALDLLAATGADGHDDILVRATEGGATLAVVGLHDAPPAVGHGRLTGTTGPIDDVPVDLVVARDDRGGWWVVTPSDGGVRTEPVAVLGSRARTVHLDGARATALTAGAADGRDLRRAVDAARVRQAALLLGISARVLGVTSAYVNQRTQFDRALVQFQSVAQRLAALVADLDGWQLLVREAAWRLDRGQDAHLASVQILAAAAEHALLATRTAVQLHGARGLRAGSVPASAYRLAAVEAVRWGPVGELWAQAGHLRADATTAA
jgi:alkylation response protein AidB-like acyl-CoA dehydrogenase